MPLLELGYPVLLLTLAQAVLASLVLILLPLALLRWRAGPAPPAGYSWRVAGYFLALGLAFLFLEIAFIQKFILFLGHPVYAVSVVLSGFLVFSGLGSRFSGRLVSCNNPVAGRRRVADYGHSKRQVRGFDQAPDEAIGFAH